MEQVSPIRRLLPRGLEPEERHEVKRGIIEGASPQRRFFILLALSTTIASFGLLTDSAAVVIGAMIIAPLMGPILGLSLGMISANHRLERTALGAEVAGVVLAVGIGLLAGLIPLNLGPSDEMLARTVPTVYDLGIAFASGLAGAYATVNRKINSTIAGVAISVALVPPLATCGLLLAMHHPRSAADAFLLFLANFFCIQIAAALVFWSFGLGYGGKDEATVWRLAGRFAPGAVALTAMAWFMTGTLVSLVKDHNLDVEIRNVLSEEISGISGGRLSEVLQRTKTEDGYTVVVSALTPRPFDPALVAQIEDRLHKRVNPNIRLIVRSLVSQDVDREGRVYVTPEEEEVSVKAREENAFLSKARDVIQQGLSNVPGATLDDLERTLNGEETILTAIVRSPETIRPDSVSNIQRELQTSLSKDVRLVVRCVFTRDADANGYLFSNEPEPQPLSATELQVRARVREALLRRLAGDPQASLLDLTFEHERAVVEVRATVRRPTLIRPADVTSVESDLRRYVDPHIRLTVQTELGAVATAGGFVSR